MRSSEVVAAVMIGGDRDPDIQIVVEQTTALLTS